MFDIIHGARRSRPLRRVAAAVLVVVGLTPRLSAEDEESPPAPQPAAYEILLLDGGRLKVQVPSETLEFVTPHGTLHIPLTDVAQIDFATRIPSELARRSAEAIGKLGAADFQTRDAAAAELLKLGAASYPDLVQAEKSSDPEVRRRAEELLERVREAFTEERLEIRVDDVVTTGKSKIAGRFTASQVLVETAQFGTLTVQFSDLRLLTGPNGGDEDPAKAIADPGSLSSYQAHLGKSFVFKITGATGGSLWGTHLYTLDSSLATAAVHAGVLKPNETKALRVWIVPAPPQFTGTTRYGITSYNYDQYPAAYRFRK